MRDTPTTQRDLLFYESTGALAYWGAWHEIPMRFAKKDEKTTPAHWRTFGQRGSQISGSQRLATNPINAMLNYL